MALIKKQLELDSVLLDKVNKLFDGGVALSFIVEHLLWALVNEAEAQNFTLNKLIEKASKDARESISYASEIPPDNV